MKTGRKMGRAVCGAVALALLLAGCGAAPGAAQEEAQTSTSYAMNTIVTQTAYGKEARQAMSRVNRALAEQEKRLSLFEEGSDIARVNRAAGQGGAEVTAETAALLRQAQVLSAQSEGAFAITIAPLTLAWGITGENPRVVPQAELDGLLPLVDDAGVTIAENRVTLTRAGMGLDLGGIAKGAACSEAAAIYEEYGVENALLSIGGNVYARGGKPDGSDWRVGFRNPNGGEENYIASLPLRNAVMAVSGGYERYFEADGTRYIHILDPRTGAPVQSDILSVGVVDEDGAAADFWSTTLFVWGRDKALDFMKQGGRAVLLDEDNRLYVSEALQEGFELTAGGYELHIVKAGEA